LRASRGNALAGYRAAAHVQVEGRRPHRVKGEAPCPQTSFGKAESVIVGYAL
jgi:hypothetical protein